MITEDLFLLRDYVYETTGIYFPDNKRYYFEKRFARRLQELKINSYRSYLDYLRGNSGGQKEFNSLVQEITINETSFYRNDAQFKAMVDIIIPEIMQIKQKSNFKKIKIWCAGCSSGEEPYTIALFLLDKLKNELKGWNVEIIGTDIDLAMIEAAKQGIYSDYSLRNVPLKIRKLYFSKLNKSRYSINRDVKNLVRFETSNLNDDFSMIFLKGFDIVFCRNVLIYFNPQSKKRVLGHLHNNLLKFGYLFLGHSESLFGVTDKFKLIHYSGGTAYKKVNY